MPEFIFLNEFLNALLSWYNSPRATHSTSILTLKLSFYAHIQFPHSKTYCDITSRVRRWIIPSIARKSVDVHEYFSDHTLSLEPWQYQRLKPSIFVNHIKPPPIDVLLSQKGGLAHFGY
jgi:hypothetical protein